MDQTQLMHQIIESIESSLTQEISLETLSKTFNYSKSHFHKTFKAITGVNLYQYIRKRRLVSASKLLVFSDMHIIDIAMLYQFSSHEAFTRSFKSLYNQSPSDYRISMRHLLDKKEAKETMETQINGWTFTGIDIEKYRITKDYNESHQSDASLRIESVDDSVNANDTFANFMQTFKADAYLNKRMKFSAFIKSQNVTGWSGLWMRIDDASYHMLGFDNMSDRPITHDTQWNQVSCVLDVPQGSVNINIGVILAGSGTIWFDSLAFEAVDNRYPTTDIRETKVTLPKAPVNLELT